MCKEVDGGCGKSMSERGKSKYRGPEADRKKILQDEQRSQPKRDHYKRQAY